MFLLNVTKSEDADDLHRAYAPHSILLIPTSLQQEIFARTHFDRLTKTHKLPTFATALESLPILALSTSGL
jgi:hypothetical protein